MHVTSILIALALILVRRALEADKENIEPQPTGEPLPAPMPPPYGISV